MPRGKQGKGRKGREAAGEKGRERAVRQALRRERKAGAYLKSGDPDFRSFSNQLAAQGLRLQDVPGDGNCLFRALAGQLHERRVTHQSLRRDIVHYMRQHRAEFEPFVAEDGSYDEYLDSLSRDGEYAGNDVVVAFTRAFSTHVVIHQLNTPRWEITAPPTATPTSSASPTLHIAYMNGEHYCCVLPATAEHALPEISAASKMEPRPQEGWSAAERGGTAVDRGEGRERGGREGKVGGSELQRVVMSTGCQDLALAQQVLSENAGDADLAIVELLQLMDLGPGGTEEVGEGGAGPGVLSGPVAVREADTSSSEKPVRSKKPCQPLPKSNPEPPAEYQRHLSNRERKAQAKSERKERRRDEQRTATKDTDKASSTFDPVGAMAI